LAARRLTGEVEVQLSIHQPVIRSHSLPEMLLRLLLLLLLVIVQAMMMCEQRARPISRISVDLRVRYSTCI